MPDNRYNTECHPESVRLIYKCYCNKCNNEFYISNQALKIRLYNNSVLCTNCNHIMPIVSTSENGIYDFIKTIYNYKIIIILVYAYYYYF